MPRGGTGFLTQMVGRSALTESGERLHYEYPHANGRCPHPGKSFTWVNPVASDTS